MGFTLRATLDLLPKSATVVVAELMPAVVDWNRGPLGPLAGHPLKDRRVRIELEDVAVTLRSNPGRFDAVLLDVDNGPAAFTSTDNTRLYNDAGLAALRAALRPGGVLGVWSAREDRKFEQRLRYGGFHVEVERVRARLKRVAPITSSFLLSRLARVSFHRQTGGTAWFSYLKRRVLRPARSARPASGAVRKLIAGPAVFI